MAVESSANDLLNLVALLGAGVVAVPVFRRLGLGSVLGYLSAGLAIGPYGLGLFTDPKSILHVAELGVVMFLFVIGLEMEPARLWSMRRAIFGLGLLQVGLCAALLSGVGMALGLAPVPAFIASTGFVLTSTAIVMQLLSERGEMGTPPGERIIAILLLEDLAIVPLLAFVSLLAPGPSESDAARLIASAIAVAAVIALVVTGRFVLNPLFRILAASHAREVMTAAALLVVLGSALAMELAGLSMAMGAFLAGVLLSTSAFKHQLEADVEPFRGILLGLFFLGVGMTLDLRVIASDWRFIAMAVVAYMIVKALAIYGVARLLRAAPREAMERAVLMAQGGEFAFVLYAAATAAGLIDARMNAMMTATVIISMALTPLAAMAFRRLLPDAALSMEGVEPIEEADNPGAKVLVIGFGRFGQILNQIFIAKGVDVTVIDNDPDCIRSAARFGFKVFYGDGSRLDVLRAAGAEDCKLVCVCIDKADTATHIVDLFHHEFPQAATYVRAFDRVHAIALMEREVDFQLRELFDAALAFGQASLMELGIPQEEAAAVVADVRQRDTARLVLQQAEGMMSGADMLHGTRIRPEPLVTPTRSSKALSDETRAIIGASAP